MLSQSNTNNIEYNHKHCECIGRKHDLGHQIHRVSIPNGIHGMIEMKQLSGLCLGSWRSS